MRNVLTIFKNDVKALVSHFWATIIILAVLILPALYAWFNIYAFWDPYSNTDNIQIAVVSEDRDYMDADGKIVNMGKELISELDGDENFGYVFLDDADAAVNGVYDGTYYAAVVVEEDFTYNMYNFLTADMDNPTISFYQNEKKNAIAVKVVEAAADEVKHSVNQKYIEAIVETLFDKLNNFSEDVQGDSSVDMLKNTLIKINDNLGTYSTTINSFINANNRLIETLNNTDGTLGYSIFLIGNEKVNISKQITYIEGSQKDLALINAEVNDMLLGLQGAVDEAIYKLDRLYSGGVEDAEAANTALEKLEQQYQELIDYLTRADISGADVDDALTALNKVREKITTLRDKLGLSTNTNPYQTRVLARYNKDLIEDVENDYEEEAVPAVYKAVTGEDYSTITEPTTSTQSMDSMMEYMVDDANVRIDSITENLALAESTNNPYVRETALQDARTDAAAVAEEMGAIDAAVTAIETAAGGGDVSAATGEAAEDSRTAKDVLDDILNGERDIDLTGDLKIVSDALNSVRITLTETVYPTLDTLMEGLQESLADVSSLLGQLADILGKAQPILNELGNTFGAVNNALIQVEDLLANYMSRIAEFIDILDGKSDNERVQTVLDFFDVDPSAVGDFLARPVDMEIETVYPVESYGAAMAPFYTMLAIWVGCIIINSILKIESPIELFGVTDAQRFFGRYLVFALISLIQTAVIMTGDVLLLGVTCMHPGLFFVAGLVASLACSMLAYGTVRAFGNIGKFLMVVILIIQIAGSGGSYPIELLPGFFRQIYLFFPFPYAINAMREAIAGLYQNAYVVYLLQLMIFFAVGLVIGLFVRRSLTGLNRYTQEQLDKTEMM